MSNQAPLAVGTGMTPRSDDRLWYLTSSVLTVLIGVFGVAISLRMIFGSKISLSISSLLPLAGLHLSSDGLSGLFDLITSIVAITAGIYVYPYLAHSRSPRTTAAFIPLFVMTMLLVPVASSYYDFLFFWEAMALVSAVLVLANHTKTEALKAGMWYIFMSQVGFAMILGSLAYLSAHSPTGLLIGGSGALKGIPTLTKNIIFVFSFFGFASKSGQLPLHSWLPKAHPEAPTPVSALMSAAMVNLGIYGIIRVDIKGLGPAPIWWGVLIITIGATTAVYSALHSLVSSDIKRLLAWSTGENMGIVICALGTFEVLKSAHNLNIAQVALAGAILQLMGHSLFKSLGFISAGSVIASAGTRSLDSMGGIIHRNPISAVGFSIAALGATGLPLGAGFVGEWLLLQSLIHTLPTRSTVLNVLMPSAVGLLALTFGLAVAAMTKAFGVGMLSRPRSRGAAESAETPPWEAFTISIATLLCIGFSFNPAFVSKIVRSASQATLGVRTKGSVSILGHITLRGVGGSISPLNLGLSVVIGAILFASITEWRIRKKSRQLDVPLWACGSSQPSSKMQYNAVAFAQPLERIFNLVVATQESLGTEHADSDMLILQSASYERSNSDIFETRLFPVVARAMSNLSRLVQKGHSGKIRNYLIYGAIGFIIVLVVAR